MRFFLTKGITIRRLSESGDKATFGTINSAGTKYTSVPSEIQPIGDSEAISGGGSQSQTYKCFVDDCWDVRARDEIIENETARRFIVIGVKPYRETTFASDFKEITMELSNE